jgi:hypothetical protein
MTIDPKRGNELLARLFGQKTLPIVNEPSAGEIDYKALSIQVWGHWPGALDAQQQRDLVALARASGVV